MTVSWLVVSQWVSWPSGLGVVGSLSVGMTSVGSLWGSGSHCQVSWRAISLGKCRWWSFDFGPSHSLRAWMWCTGWCQRQCTGHPGFYSIQYPLPLRCFFFSWRRLTSFFGEPHQTSLLCLYPKWSCETRYRKDQSENWYGTYLIKTTIGLSIFEFTDYLSEFLSGKVVNIWCGVYSNGKKSD